MTYRPIEAFDTILRETPPAARYLDLYWSVATTYADWREIRSRMSGAVHAVQQLDPEAASDYALLRDIAGQRADDSVNVVQAFPYVVAA